MFKSTKKDYDYVDFLIKLVDMGKILWYDLNMDLGRYYGYPKCCIKHFARYQEMGIKMVGLYMDIMYGDADDNYVKCTKCINKEMKKKNKLINF